MNKLELTTMRIIMESYTRKAPDWSYEREWRIVRDKGACGELWDESSCGALLPSVTPKEIILGAEAEGQFVERIKQYCDDNDVALFIMEKDYSEYKLNKVPISC